MLTGCVIDGISGSEETSLGGPGSAFQGTRHEAAHAKPLVKVGPDSLTSCKGTHFQFCSETVSETNIHHTQRWQKAASDISGASQLFPRMVVKTCPSPCGASQGEPEPFSSDTLGQF